MQPARTQMPRSIAELQVYQPTGRPITFEIQDFMHCKGKRIRIKEGWIDGLAIRDQLTRPAR